MKRSRDKNIVSFEVVNIRSFSIGAYNKVDDVVYGGGAGMLLMPGPVTEALMSVEAKGKKVILTSAKGKKFDQKKARELSKLNDIVIVAGHYEGIDERFLSTCVDELISLGDFVLSGAELAACALIDAIVRQLPGAIKDLSASDESFSTGLLDAPHYTRPEEWHGMRVPDVLLTGHHANIEAWRREKSLEATLKNRPELIERARQKGLLTKRDEKTLVMLSPKN